MKKAKYLILSTILYSLFLVGCAPIVIPGSTIPMGPDGICYVRDISGRSWHITGPRPCARALQACRNWHANHGIYNGRCMVQ
jgi:hypothetical protein